MHLLWLLLYGSTCTVHTTISDSQLMQTRHFGTGFGSMKYGNEDVPEAMTVGWRAACESIRRHPGRLLASSEPDPSCRGPLCMLPLEGIGRGGGYIPVVWSGWGS